MSATQSLKTRLRVAPSRHVCSVSRTVAGGRIRSVITLYPDLWRRLALLPRDKVELIVTVRGLLIRRHVAGADRDHRTGDRYVVSASGSSLNLRLFVSGDVVFDKWAYCLEELIFNGDSVFLPRRLEAVQVKEPPNPLRRSNRDPDVACTVSFGSYRKFPLLMINLRPQLCAALGFTGGTRVSVYTEGDRLVVEGAPEGKVFLTSQYDGGPLRAAVVTERAGEKRVVFNRDVEVTPGRLTLPAI